MLDEVLSVQPVAAAPGLARAAPAASVPSGMKDGAGGNGGTAAPPLPRRVPVPIAAGVPDYIHSLQESDARRQSAPLADSGARPSKGPVDHRRTQGGPRGPGEGEESQTKRGVLPYLLGALALLVGIPALPVAAASGAAWSGAALASLGILLALCAAVSSLKRRAAGIGLALIALAVSGSSLYTVVMLAGGPREFVHTLEDRKEGGNNQVPSARNQGPELGKQPTEDQQPEKEPGGEKAPEKGAAENAPEKGAGQEVSEGKGAGEKVPEKKREEWPPAQPAPQRKPEPKEVAIREAVQGLKAESVEDRVRAAEQLARIIH